LASAKSGEHDSGHILVLPFLVDGDVNTASDFVRRRNFGFAGGAFLGHGSGGWIGALKIEKILRFCGY
jgi:hypothetical protein